MNVICIMADSLRRDHLGCYGNDWIKTPHLDAFAREAIVFDQAWAGSWPTVPNRTDLLTGRYSFLEHGWQPLDRQVPTLASVLEKQGLVSMLIGDTPHLFKEDFFFQRGFSGWEWNRGQEGDALVTDPRIPLVYPCAKYKLRRPEPEGYETIIRNRAHRRVETDWFALGTVSRAMDWLERNRGHERFLLWVDLFDPHEPWDPPSYYVDLYHPHYQGESCDYPRYGVCDFLSAAELKQTQALYAAEVTMVDRAVGCLLEKAAQLGLFDNTLILFMSDHGHYLNYPGDQGLIGKPSPNHEYLYRSMIHIPFLLRLPRGEASGQRRNALVQPCDVMPTVLDFFGLANGPEMQGHSLLQVARGQARQVRNYALSGQHQGAISITDGRWQLGVTCDLGKLFLFDNLADPYQQRNLLSSQQRLALTYQKELLKQLRALGVPEETVMRYAR